MASYFFLVMACVSIIKTLQVSLYLHSRGFDRNLPMLYAALALLAGPIVILHRFLTRRYSHVVIVSSTLAFLFVSLAIFSFVLSGSGSWIYLLFYLWAGLFTLLLPTLGWVISYDLFRVREAKRLFSLLATGGIVGGIFGSAYAFLAARHINWLVMQVLLFLLLLQGLMLMLYRDGRRAPRTRRQNHADGEKSRPAPAPGLRQLLTSRHVRYLAGVVLVAALATTVIDLNYQWHLNLVPRNSAEELTKIVASILGMIYVLAAVVQLFGTRRILQKFGLPAALLIPPLGLGAGSLLALVFPGFLPAAGVKALDGTLRPSLHLTGVEMSYVLLSGRQTTLPLKSFIDLAVFRLGDAMGALIFLTMSTLIADPSRLAAAVQLLAVALWGFLAMQLSREYVLNLRRTVHEGTSVKRMEVPEEETAAELLLETIQSADPVRIRLALHRLKQIDHRETEVPLEFPLHGENLMQSRVSGVVSTESRWVQASKDLLEHPDPQIGAGAFHLLIRRDPNRYKEVLARELNSEWLPHPLYLHYLDQYVERPGQFLKPALVLRWCQNLVPSQRALMARLMGKTGERAYVPVLRDWAQWGPGSSTGAAIEALGHFTEPRFLPVSIRLLGSCWSRRFARQALAAHGEAAIPYLASILQEPTADHAIKREIPSVLGLIRSSSAREMIVSALYQPDPQVSYRALKALNRIRQFQDLSYSGGTFLPVVEFWARQYYTFVNLESVQERSEASSSRLLHRALLERKDRTMEKIFRTLELFLPRGDAYNCYQILIRQRGELRDHALELIDAQLDRQIKPILLPLLMELNADELARIGRRLYRLPDRPAAIISDALFGADPWFRCCVLAAVTDWSLVKSESRSELITIVQHCGSDINPLVRQTANWVLSRLQAGQPTTLESN